MEVDVSSPRNPQQIAVLFEGGVLLENQGTDGCP